MVFGCLLVIFFLSLYYIVMGRIAGVVTRVIRKAHGIFLSLSRNLFSPSPNLIWCRLILCLKVLYIILNNVVCI